MANEKPLSDIAKEYGELVKNDYEEAYKNVDKALMQIRAYLVDTPLNLTEKETKVIANLGKEVGQSAMALEQKILALKGGGYFRE